MERVEQVKCGLWREVKSNDVNVAMPVFMICHMLQVFDKEF